jgi:hypothetical protein
MSPLSPLDLKLAGIFARVVEEPMRTGLKSAVDDQPVTQLQVLMHLQDDRCHGYSIGAWAAIKSRYSCVDCRVVGLESSSREFVCGRWQGVDCRPASAL